MRTTIRNLLALGLALTLSGSPAAMAAAFQNGGIRHDIVAVATSGGTTTLTRTSSQVQVFTGTLGQTVVLPDATQLQPGYWYIVSNKSTAALTINASGGSLVANAAAGLNATYYLRDNSTAAGVWDVQSGGTLYTAGNGLSLSNGQFALTSPVTIANGGTAGTTKQAGFDNLSPNATKGDTAVYNGTNNVAQSVAQTGFGKMGDPSSATGYSDNDFGDVDILRNVGLTTTFGSGAMTITLSGKSNAGAAVALSTSNTARIAFNDPTGGSIPFVEPLTGNLSLVVPSGAKLGLNYLKSTPLYVYAVYKGGASNRVFLGVSATPQDETRTKDSTIITDTGAGASALYSTTVNAGNSVRLVGIIYASEATPGTWVGTGYTYAGAGSGVKNAGAQVNIGGQDLGSATFTGAYWQTNSTSFIAPPVASGTPVITPRGGASASGTSLAITVPRVPAGRVKIVFSGDLLAGNSSSTGNITYRFSDGSSFSNENPQMNNNVANNYNSSMGAIFYFDYAAPKTNVTFTLQCKTSAGATAVCGQGYGTSEIASINVESIPTQAQLAGTVITKDPVTSIAAFMASGTRVTTTPTQLGQWRSYTRAASSTTFTDAAPATLPTSINGALLYGGNAWGTADAANSPSRYEIFIGQNKAYKFQAYMNTGRSGYVDTTVTVSGAVSNCFGTMQNYDPSTGIIEIVPRLNAGCTGGQTPGLTNQGTVGVNNIYFDIYTYDNPLAAGLTAAKNELRFFGQSGLGSTATKTPYFARVINNAGDAATFTSDSTNGTVVTIAKDVQATVCGSYELQNGNYFGAAQNLTGSSITGDIGAWTDDQVIFRTVSANASGSGYLNAGCGTRNFSRGAVIRPMIGTAATAALADKAYFSIVFANDVFQTAGNTGGVTEYSSHVWNNANQALTANQVVIFPVIDYDTSGLYNGTNGRWTAPVAGRYEINCGFLYTSAAATFYTTKNGVRNFTIGNGINGNPAGGSASMQMAAGDYMTINSDSAVTLYGSNGATPFGMNCTFKKIN